MQDTIRRHIKRITTRHDVRRSATINSSRYARDARYGNGGAGGGAAESVLSKQRKKSRCGSIATPVSRGTPTACAPGDRGAQNGYERLSILNRQLTVDSTSPSTTTTVESTSSSIGAEMKLMVRTSPAAESSSPSTTTALISPSLANGARRNGRDHFKVNGENVKRTAV